jgi:hypothetical protein
MTLNNETPKIAKPKKGRKSKKPPKTEVTNPEEEFDIVSSTVF